MSSDFSDLIFSRLSSDDIIKLVGDVADEFGVEVFIVGGFVRDLLIGRDNYDIDIVCLDKVFFIANKLAERISADEFTVYSKFGVAMIKKGNIVMEFVNARKESYNFDSRKPIVESGTFEDDQMRRDFTINTLAVGLNKNNFGHLIDTFGGVDDLKNGIIKTPVNPCCTFSDDPLRMLRAIRFATQLDFRIDDDTFNGIIECRNRIKIVSRERIKVELEKIIMSPKPSIGFYLLSKSGLLDIIMPYIDSLKGRIQVGKFSHKDIFIHTLQVLDNVASRSDNIWLRWAALFHDVAKPKTKRFDNLRGFSFHGHEELGARMMKDIFRSLTLSNSHLSYVEKLIRLHLRPITIAQDVVTDSAVRRLVFEVGDDFNDLMILCRADITSHNPLKINEYLSNFDRVEDKVKSLLEKDFIRNLQPVISGDMIMNEFNIKGGPIVGVIKSRLKEAILNCEVDNEYDKLHEFMLKFVKESGLFDDK